MTKKLGKMVTYLECLVPINPNDHINTWFCKVMGQIKNIIYLQPQYLWPQNLAG